MKKQLLFGLFAAVSMLCAAMFTACTEDEAIAATSTTRIVLHKPAATAETLTDYILVRAVYDAKGNLIPGFSETKENAFATATETVNVDLVQNQTYTFVFWAYKKQAQNVYDCTDLQNITIDYAEFAKLGNGYDCDAFFASQEITPVSGTVVSQNIQLKRPFAQINFAIDTTEYKKIEAAGTQLLQSQIAVTGLAGGFNALTGEAVGTATDVTFDLAALPTDTISVNLLDTGYHGYRLLASSLVLPNVPDTASRTITNVKFTIQTNGQDIVLESNNTPIQANYRTNVIGSLVQEATLYVEIKHDFLSDINKKAEEETTIINLIEEGGAVTVNAPISVIDFTQMDLTEDVHVYLNAGVDKVILGNKEAASPAPAPAPAQRRAAAEGGFFQVIIEILEGITAPKFEWKGEPTNFAIILADGVRQTSKSTYELSNYAGLKWLDEQVTGGNTFSKATVLLTTDIDMAETGNWTGIGGSGHKSFQGTFDGQEHTIKNMQAYNSYSYGNGFFTNIISGAIKNITFDNANLSYKNPPAYGGNVYGIVAAYAYGTVAFENVHVKNSLIAAFGKVGAILGMGAEPGSSVTSFQDCSVTNTTIAGVYNTGALAGLTQNVTTVTNCTVEGIKFLNPTVAQGYEYITVNTTRKDDANIKIEGKYWKYPYEEDGETKYWYYATNATYYNEYWGNIEAYTAEDLAIDGRPHNTIE